MKKMITFLGTGDYKPVVYEYKQKVIQSSFVQIALAEFFRPEEVVVCVTEEAKQQNWLGNQKQESDGHRAKGLREAAREALPDIPFYTIDIPNGQNLEEIWQVFSILEEVINTNDVLIIDVTHAFRSIPIVALACTQYLGLLQNVSLEGIYYGAFEAKRKSENTYIAPVFDLTAFAELMEWSQAVTIFEQFGEMGGIKKLFDREVDPRRKASQGQDREAKLLRDIGHGLNTASVRSATCRGRDIYKDPIFERISEKLTELEDTFATGKAFGPLLDRIRSKLQSLECTDQGFSDEVRRGFEAVNWCLEHNLVQQGYTLLQENTITHFCQLCDLDAYRRAEREMVSSALGRLYWIPKEQWTAKDLNNEQEINRVQQMAGESVFKVYDKLSKLRNDINHAGIVQPIKPEKLISELRKSKEDLMAALECGQ